MTRRTEYFLPIALALEELGGSAHLDEVLARVENRMSGQLTDFDRAMLPAGYEVRWRNSARWAKQIMVDEGLLKHDSPRAIWEFTDLGRQWLIEHCQ